MQNQSPQDQPKWKTNRIDRLKTTHYMKIALKGLEDWLWATVCGLPYRWHTDRWVQMHDFEKCQQNTLCFSMRMKKWKYYAFMRLLARIFIHFKKFNRIIKKTQWSFLNDCMVFLQKITFSKLLKIVTLFRFSFGSQQQQHQHQPNVVVADSSWNRTVLLIQSIMHSDKTKHCHKQLDT